MTAEQQKKLTPFEMAERLERVANICVHLGNIDTRMTVANLREIAECIRSATGGINK